MLEEVKMLKIFILMCSFLVSVTANANEILSKEDAGKTFNKSFVQWAASLMLVEENKLGKSAVASEYEWTMIIDQGHSILKITPSYFRDELMRPYKLSVGVEHRKEFSAFANSMSDLEIKKMISKWYNQMLPEYTVMTQVDLKDGIVQFNFTIFEYGKNPIIDLAGKKTDGCWQVCIKR